MSCKITTGLDGGCEYFVGGLKERFWVGYTTDLSSAVDTSQSGNIPVIPFSPGGYLRRFETPKNANRYQVDLVVESKKRKHWIHTVSVKVLSYSTNSDVILQDLSGRKDIFFILEDNNRRFFLVGANGMRANTLAQNTGASPDSDTSDSMTFVGRDKIRSLRFGVGDYDDILNLLSIYESGETVDGIFDYTFDLTFE